MLSKFDFQRWKSNRNRSINELDFNALFVTIFFIKGSRYVGEFYVFKKAKIMQVTVQLESNRSLQPI